MIADVVYVCCVFTISDLCFRNINIHFLDRVKGGGMFLNVNRSSWDSLQAQVYFLNFVCQEHFNNDTNEQVSLSDVHFNVVVDGQELYLLSPFA